MTNGYVYIAEKNHSLNEKRIYKICSRLKFNRNEYGKHVTHQNY